MERLVVGDDFTPEVGFVRRHDMRRNFGRFRFSPRLRSVQSVRKVSWTGSLDYIENGAGRVETRIADGMFAIDFENTDQFNVSYTNTYEAVPVPLSLAPGVIVPTGDYDYASWA